jgi:hypothetical protein
LMTGGLGVDPQGCRLDSSRRGQSVLLPDPRQHHLCPRKQRSERAHSATSLRGRTPTRGKKGYSTVCRLMRFSRWTRACGDGSPAASSGPTPCRSSSIGSQPAWDWRGCAGSEARASRP